MNYNSIAEKFDISGDVLNVIKFGNGHINDTLLVETSSNKYVLQRLNRNVFKEPEKVMANILGVTEYLKPRLSGKVQTLNFIAGKNGEKYILDEDEFLWRMYEFVDNGVSLDMPETEIDFYQSAVGFGNFQNMLKDYPADTLYETIPNFHNTPDRYQKFLEAVEKDPLGRAATALEEIAFVNERKEFYSILEDNHKMGKLPLKVTHNDTKLNNVMLDIVTREPICVMDLDTIMPGYSVNDFGDSIRFGASTAAEDEKDLSKVHFDIELFKIYTKGFLSGCDGTLTECEQELLPVGAKMMTIECGMRFLTDYILGDTYFKTAYPEHNLVRCRTQFKLVSEMEERWNEMCDFIKEFKL